ncbi:MAG: arginyltransferase [Gammaproteobacteria bacterium]|nr:MAG: arginyltransferase [Gammaproteobacteria bacterium]
MSGSSINEEIDRLTFYRTPEHECNYLPDRQASTIFVDPTAELNTAMYTDLARYGFRRSGRYLYKPHCTGCNACIPIRIPVKDFKENRNQRRVWKRNADIKTTIMDSTFRQEHYDLYERYLISRHPGGGMDETTPEKYQNFLSCQWLRSKYVEFRLDDRLIAVAVVDVMMNGLSAVYTFFDPDDHARSPGAYAILWQIKWAKQRGLNWVYLGYWIEESRKMNYKTQYRPYEILKGNRWQRITE